METSDSECFESADEEIHSEDEVKNVKSIDKVVSDNKAVFEKSKMENFEKSIKKIELEEKSQDDLSNKNVIKNETLFNKSVKTNSDENANSAKKPIKESKIGIKNPKGKKKIVSKNTKDDCIEKQTVTKEVIQINKISEKDIVLDDEEIDWATEGAKEQVNKPIENEIQDNESDNLWSDNENWENLSTSKEPTKPKINSSCQKTVENDLENESNSGWGSWGNWGVSSIINTATSSVSTITSQVSQGISTVLESGIGVPDPEELARINKEEDEKYQKLKQSTNVENNDKNDFEVKNVFGFGNLVSGVTHLTKLVESTSTKVISGGLDTLETIGKKTMEVLQEGDPGLKKKRAFLKLDQDKPVLSQVLREAKERAEQENKELEEKHLKKNLKNYETLFDDHQGLVHLEALEMLSKQCSIKLQNSCESLCGDALTELQETMDQIKELCELPDEDEEEEKPSFDEMKNRISKAVQDMDIQISYDKLINMWMESERWLDSLKLSVCSDSELHQQGIDTLAQLTAAAVEQFHKAGELLLVKDHRSTADEADSLVQLTTILTSLIGIMADKFSDKLNAKAQENGDKDSTDRKSVG